MRKENLLRRMRELGACGPATDYVRQHPSDDAATIWKECLNHDWLIWFVARVRPKWAARFAGRCAVRTHCTLPPSLVTLPYHHDFETLARNARLAASNYLAERDEQLRDLHSWADGWR